MMQNVAGFFRGQNKQMKGFLFPKTKEEKQNTANYVKRGWFLTVRMLSEWSEVEPIDRRDILPTDNKIAYSTFAVSLFMLIFSINWMYDPVRVLPAVLGGLSIPDWLLATVCALVTTFVCWELVYRDSYIPGVDPPTPMSIKRIRNGKIERHGFHLNYIAPLVMGIMVFSAIYFRQYVI